MNETTHTPPEWRHAKKGNLGNCIEGPTGQCDYEGDDGYRTVAMAQACTASHQYLDREANCAANIALIVRAVNCHQALVDACNSALLWLGHCDPDTAQGEIAAELRAALAKAAP